MEKKFTKSGQNVIAIGARLGEIGPSKLDSHPPNFYKSNRLNSKAGMHDFR